MKQLNWWKSIVSMGVILGSMPMVHLVARVLKDNYDGTQLLGAGMAVGFVGMMMVVVGVFVKGQTRQTLLGLIGGIPKCLQLPQLVADAFLGEEQATHRRSPDDTPHQHCYLHGNQHNALDLLSPADEPLRSSIVWS